MAGAKGMDRRYQTVQTVKKTEAAVKLAVETLLGAPRQL
jgi:hypothetical protein